MEIRRKETFSQDLENNLPDSEKLEESSEGGDNDDFTEPGELGVR